MATDAGAEVGGARWGGAAFLVVAALLLSLSMTLTPVAYEAGLSPLTIIALRPLSFTVVFWLLGRASGRRMALPSRERWIALVLGILFVLGTGGYLASLATLPVSLAVLVFYGYPLLTLLVASLFERRWPRPLQLGALLTAFFGLGLALGVDLTGLHPVGLALVAAGALALALTFYWLGRTLAGQDTWSVALHMNVSGFGLALLMLLAGGGPAWPDGQGAFGWLMLAMVLATFIVGLFCSFRGVMLIGGVRAATIMNLEPVATIALAVAILGESLSPLQFAGAALVILAVAAAQRRG